MWRLLFFIFDWDGLNLSVKAPKVPSCLVLLNPHPHTYKALIMLGMRLNNTLFYIENLSQSREVPNKFWMSLSESPCPLLWGQKLFLYLHQWTQTLIGMELTADSQDNRKTWLSCFGVKTHWSICCYCSCIICVFIVKFTIYIVDYHLRLVNLPKIVINSWPW